MALLEFQNVERHYKLGKSLWKLGPLSFCVEPRELIAIVGASGSGKSTLLHLAGNIDAPSTGSIFFDGKELSAFSEKEQEQYRNTQIGFVFQDFYLFPEFSLLENVAMPLLIRGEKKEKAFTQALNTLQKVGLEKKSAHFPKELSGGERQRGAIARAIIQNPKILLADEPTGNLDAHTGETILKLLLQLQKESGLTLLLVTHDEHIAALMQRCITLCDGKISADTKK